MSKHEWFAIGLYAGMIAVILSLTIGFTVWKSSQEAASYRKFCDTPVTTWDAIFLDLRIDECECDR